MDRQPHDDLIGNDLAENYRRILDDPNRTETPKRLAEWAEKHNTPQLAAWARAESDARKSVREQAAAAKSAPSADDAAKARAAAAGNGDDTTPTSATPAQAGKAPAEKPAAKPRARRGAKAETPAEDEKAAESVIDDSLDDQLAPPAEKPTTAGDDADSK